MAGRREQVAGRRALGGKKVTLFWELSAMMQPKISAFFKPSDPKSLEKCEHPESDLQRY